MKSIFNHENLDGKNILLRLDLNVPINKGKITDETRINKILPILNFLIKKKTKIIVISHIGRPKGKIQKHLSLKPICEKLENKLKKKINLITENIFNLKRKDLFINDNEELIFLENIRFYEEEEKNDEKFSKHLASFADLFVNDAFSCSHRAHASVSKITEFLPSFAGLQMETEINALRKVQERLKIQCRGWEPIIETLLNKKFLDQEQVTGFPVFPLRLHQLDCFGHGASIFQNLGGLTLCF